MATQFSIDGKYFAQISNEGKVKIWNTLSNTFEQEFTPDFHLTSPCTCLHFLDNGSICKAAIPRKKKRRNSTSSSPPNLAIGTTSGLLLIYSIAKADMEFTIDSKLSQTISCLSANGTEVFSGADQSILVWNLELKTVASKWSSGNDKISAILVIPDTNKLLTAAKNIKLWDIESRELLRTFTGHSSQICFLEYISTKSNSGYLISGSKGDRVLSCWSLNENSDCKNTIANFLMEDIVYYISIYTDSDGNTSMAVTVRSGVVHVYKHTLNGKCAKPIKPKTTIQIAADSQETNDPIQSININAAIYRDNSNLCICYGSLVKMFEDIEVVTNKKIQCLLRSDPQSRMKTLKEKQISKNRTPIVGNDVNYLTSQSSGTSLVNNKRKVDGLQEMPLEERLGNLMINKFDGSSKVPKADNVAHLLTQALQSKDKNLLRSVLCKRDEQIIKNTLKRMSLQIIVPLVEELTNLIKGKTLSCEIGCLWLKHLVGIHSGLLLSNPDLSKLLSPTVGIIETRLSLQTPLNKLKGRLDLLTAQVNNVVSQENDENEAPLLVFNDRASSDSENDEIEMNFASDSENEWIEDSIDEEEHENAEEENGDKSEEEMSS